MSTPTDRNRLADEQSPYLRQHADNPVNWQPWDETAFDAARDRDAPIFLSIGYSACHWCHVMEEESFQNEEIADLLNEYFVPVKVDREERPDVDSLYMTVCQLVTGSGGWPLSAFLTPAGKPFYVGTYFPPEARPGQPGFKQLLEDVIEAWENDRAEIEDRAEQWTQAARGELESVPEQSGTPDEGLLEEAAQAAVRSADRDHGGFGGDQKFPQPRRVQLLLRAYAFTGRDVFRTVATEALDAMVAGGLYDHIGGGFHRYCTDREWIVPHFEKMLYDNAEIPRALLEGYRVSGNRQYRQAVEETLAFVERELRHPDGAFFSTLDARSPDPDTGESEEGAFYVWTPTQVHSAISDSLRADLVCDRFGITEGGNFEGATVLTTQASIADLAEDYDLTPAAVRDHLDAGRQALFQGRERRPRPARDEKVLAGWNGLMISTFAEAALTVDSEYAETAAAALEFLRTNLWDSDDQRLSRRYKDGDVAIDGYLEDYAFVARGALDLYGISGDVEHLAFAIDLGRTIREEFWDEDAQTVYLTPASGPSLVARPQELSDRSTPASAGIAADVADILDHFVPHEDFAAIAEGIVETHGERLASHPLQHVTLVTVADARQRGRLEVTIVAEDLPETWRNKLGEAYLPDRLLAPRPPSPDRLDEWLETLDLETAPPIWANREQSNGDPTVFVCRRACSPPVTDITDALEWAHELS